MESENPVPFTDCRTCRPAACEGCAQFKSFVNSRVASGPLPRAGEFGSVFAKGDARPARGTPRAFISMCRKIPGTTPTLYFKAAAKG
jgi:hypothetical protein